MDRLRYSIDHMSWAEIGLCLLASIAMFGNMILPNNASKPDQITLIPTPTPITILAVNDNCYGVTEWQTIESGQKIPRTLNSVACPTATPQP